MTEGLKGKLRTILKIILIVFVIFLFTKIWKYIVPFIIAYFFASSIEPIVKFGENKIKVPRKIGTVFSMLFVLGSISSIVAFLISRLVKEIRNVYYSLEINAESLTQFFENIISQTNKFFIQLPIEMTDILDQSINTITNNLQGVLKSVVDLIQVPIQAALNIPQVLIFVIVTLVSTYFMSSDKESILKFLDLQIPTEWLSKSKGITKNIFSAIFGWLKAQLILTSITFFEVLVGLLILGTENTLLIALLIALVDVLPILGAGTVLIPWSIIVLILGNVKMGLSLLLLYLIIVLVRQFIEPKVLGSQIGVHPLFTLAGMYIGLKSWGVAGMFIGPIGIVLIKLIFGEFVKADTFKNWIDRNFGIRRAPSTPNNSVDNSNNKDSDNSSADNEDQ